jgi:hypothetical protein
MNFSKSRRRALERRFALTLTALAAAAAIAALGAPSSSASAFGQLAAWGANGTGPGELQLPTLLGVEPPEGLGEGSIYLADLPEGFGGHPLRIQKFAAGTGALEASASIPTSEEAFQGIAVDPAKHRFYLLQYAAEADPETERAAAQRILVFSTIPNGSDELVPPEGGPEFLPVPNPTEANAIDNPRSLTLDPSNGDLVISGESRQRHFVLQRIHTEGSGSLGPRYTEAEATIPHPNESGVRLAVAVGPDGKTFVMKSQALESGASSTRVFTLPADFSGSPTAVPGFAAAAEEEGWGQPMESSKPAEGFPLSGPQMAISPDGSTLYWKEQFGGAVSGATTPGSYLVRGYSLADKHTGVLYGGNEEELECTIQTKTAALAASGEDLYVFDQGPQTLEEAPYGVHVFKFGPGGEKCPAPSASFALKNGGTEITGPVSAGTNVTLDGSSSELGAWATEESMTWKIEGPGATFEETVPSGDPTPLKLDHVFNEEGTYTVRLAMKVSGSVISANGTGTVFAAPTKELVVTAASQESPTVTDDAVGTITSTSAVLNAHVNANGADATCTFQVALAADTTFSSPVKTVNCSPNPVSGGAGNTAVSATATGLDPSTAYIYRAVADNTSGGGGLTDGTPNEPFTTSAPAQKQLTVSKSGTGAGTVTSSPGGINCGSTCVASFAEGATVTLMATASSGSSFAGWGGACSGTGPCVVALSSAKAVGATFNANTPAGGGGTGGGSSGGGTGGTGTGSGKTPAELNREKRQKALKKCRKLHGKARARCVKHANQIGKSPKRSETSTPSRSPLDLTDWISWIGLTL